MGRGWASGTAGLGPLLAPGARRHDHPLPPLRTLVGSSSLLGGSELPLPQAQAAPAPCPALCPEPLRETSFLGSGGDRGPRWGTRPNHRNELCGPDVLSYLI